MLVSTLFTTALFMAPPLEEPWGCGDSYIVSQGNNSAVSHNGSEAFAWDFDLDEGHFVHAVAGGTVTMVREDSTVGGCSSDFGNAANYVVIDHGDGTGGLYLHFAPNSSPLSVGDPVRAGDMIGRVGLTGWVCGDHLHYQTQEVCGSWYCQSVMASFDDYGVPGYGVSMQSDNCVPCERALDGGVTEIDEADFGCFTGAQQHWTTSTAGLGAHHLHTAATAGGGDLGVWRFGVDTPGTYALDVHIPSNHATAAVSYRVVSDEGVTDVAVNQVDLVGWHGLGEFSFGSSEDDPRVELSNNSGSAGARVAYDAIRLSFIEGPPGESGSTDGGDETGGGDSTAGTTADPSTSAGSDGNTSSAGDTAEPTTAGDSAGDDGSPSGTSGGTTVGESSGAGSGDALPGYGGSNAESGCRTGGDPGGLLLLALLGIRRRRYRLRSQ
ncbi:MAG: peptidoglycan DD-metalloendopeptidase family protein [Myxococcota bacterium]